MSEVKVNKISPRTACGTVTLGDSGDTFTIPSGATITNSGTASGFGATGETSWDTTVKTTGTFTATAGVGYFLNTTGGIITVNLPVGAAGSSVAMADYAATWQTNNVTVSPNGSEKIGGVNADVTLSTEGQSVTFVYIDSTQGWVNVLDSTSNVRGALFVTATGGTPCSGAIVCTNYKVHTFTGPGTFCVSCAGGACGSNTVDYMVVAGGGSGGGITGTDGGGGAGAGGYRESPGTASGCYTASPLGVSPAVALAVPVQGYPITVGGGAVAAPAAGTQGSNSVFSTITSTGGGGGGTASSGGTGGTGGDGGSGGGGGGGHAGGVAGGSGDTPSAPVAQGKDGGVGGASPTDKLSGGGGGATVAGVSADNPTSGPGGAGATSSINATPTARAGGGGGGGAPPTPGASGAAGAGGGGAGGVGGPPGGGISPGTAGTTNTGGGGGGGGGGTCGGLGGAGGSGTVIIRYKFQ